MIESDARALMQPRGNPIGRAVVPSLALVFSVIGALVALLSARDIDVNDSDAYGLISALPFGYFVGVGLVVASFVFALRRERLNRPLLTLQLLAIVVLLYGLASYIEDVARLPTTWVHAGFIEYIQRTGEVLHNYDARFEWPGFFAGGALLNMMGGTTDQMAVLSWAPLVFNVAYVLPIWVIARSTGISERSSWLATLLFVLLNWVGQDYYSPQGLNYLLALSFLAVLLRLFATDAGIVPRWMKGNIEPFIRRRLPKLSTRVEGLQLQPSNTPPVRISGVQKAGVLFLIVVIYSASVVSHQLTPFFLVLVVLGLVVLDRISARGLPVIMLVAVFVWISYAALPFWQNNINNIFGSTGQVGNVVSQGVGNRVTGDPAHLPVIYGRLALAAVLWLTAVVGFFVRLRQRRVDVLCIVGFIGPFAVLGGQAYGGEAVLRVYLFALPFAVTLAASALASSRAPKWGLPSTAVVLVVSLALLPVFFVARYGNEYYEHFDSQDLAMVTKLYQVAPAGSTLVALNSDLPWRNDRIEDYKFATLPNAVVSENGPQLAKNTVTAPKGTKAFLIVTDSQKRYAEIVQGQTKTWADGFVQTLVTSGDFKVLYQEGGASILVPGDQQ